MARRIYQNKSVKSKQTSSPWDRALKYLARRPRTEKEMRDYLREECTDEIINRLKELNFINDEEFAAWYADQRARFRPRSRKMISFELKRKGIDSSKLKNQISNVSDQELAMKAIEKKLRLWKELDYTEFRVKATRFLASRGFSWDIIETTVKKAYNTHHVN
jgi:regulatory protein